MFRCSPVRLLPVGKLVQLSRLQGILGLAALLAVGCLCLRDPDPSPPGLEAGDITPWWEAARLDTRFIMAEERRLTLRHIAQKVMDGRLTLREAARRYRDHNATNPGFDRRSFEVGFPGGNDEERCCRQVITRVECELGHAPERARAVRLQLEAVLEGCRRQGLVSLSP
jgi:hypothetical protein